MFNYFFCSLFIRKVLVLLTLLSLVACGGSSDNPTPVIALSSSSTLSNLPSSSSRVSSSNSSSIHSSSLSSALLMSSSSSLTINPFLIGGAIQKHPLNTVSVVSTLANMGATATLDYPIGIVIVGSNFYVADSEGNTIRKVSIATGAVTTLAGATEKIGSDDGTGAAARFYSPHSITTDGINLYVADTSNNTIRKVVIATGAVTTLAGKAGVSGSANGTGTSASFNFPHGITTDGTNLYVADTDNHTIRKIVIATGVVTTFAGKTGVEGSTDGIGTNATFYYPSSITTDGSNLYLTETSGLIIRKIVIATGAVSIVAGAAEKRGSDDGIGAEATFSSPQGISTDGTNLYVTDSGNHTVRKIVIATGEVSTLAGTAQSADMTDGIGGDARFDYPQGLTTDGSNLYVADTLNHTLRKIVIDTGVVTTIAGKAGHAGGIDGIGVAASLYSFNTTTDGSNLYVADTNNLTIRKVAIATGVVSTLAGTEGTKGSSDGTGTDASFSYPTGITTDGNSIYVTDTDNHTIRKVVIATGTVTTLAGTVGTKGSADGTGVAASFDSPQGITTDGSNLYVADTNNHTIRKIVIATGAVTTLAGITGQEGANDDIGSDSHFAYPRGITTDGNNLYVTDTNNHTIRQIVISTGTVSTLAGSAGQDGSNDGTGTASHFAYPRGITTDGSNLYVADTHNHILRKIVIATGAVTTLAGTAGIHDSIDGVGATASFYYPVGITTDGFDVFVTDSHHNTIRKIH